MALQLLPPVQSEEGAPILPTGAGAGTPILHKGVRIIVVLANDHYQNINNIPHPCIADIYMNWALLFNGFVKGKNRHRYTVVLLVLFLDIIVNNLIGLTPLVDNFARKFIIFTHVLCLFLFNRILNFYPYFLVN